MSGEAVPDRAAHSGPAPSEAERALQYAKDSLFEMANCEQHPYIGQVLDRLYAALRAAPSGEPSRRIYVAASWRTPIQPAVVARLRAEGFEVYDFRNPSPPFTGPDAATAGFAWSEIDPEWQQWDSREYVAALAHPLAVKGFRTDMDALRLADTVVLVQPSGRSAALELGWSCGAGKRTAVLLADGQEPELMLRMADLLTPSLDELVGWLRANRLPLRATPAEPGASPPDDAAFVALGELRAAVADEVILRGASAREHPKLVAAFHSSGEVLAARSPAPAGDAPRITPDEIGNLVPLKLSEAECLRIADYLNRRAGDAPREDALRYLVGALSALGVPSPENVSSVANLEKHKDKLTADVWRAWAALRGAVSPSPGTRAASEGEA
jgi:hypothetical protein